MGANCQTLRPWYQVSSRFGDRVRGVGRRSGLAAVRWPAASVLCSSPSCASKAVARAATAASSRCAAACALVAWSRCVLQGRFAHVTLTCLRAQVGAIFLRFLPRPIEFGVHAILDGTHVPSLRLALPSKGQLPLGDVRLKGAELSVQPLGPQVCGVALGAECLARRQPRLGAHHDRPTPDKPA